MKKITENFHIMLILAMTVLLASCYSEDWLERYPEENHTMIVFMPWSSNLLPAFQQNINDIEASMREGQLEGARVIIALATSPSEMEVTELRYTSGKSKRETLMTYQRMDFTRQQAITALLNDIKAVAPNPRYSLVIGSHGLAWLPAAATASTMRSARRSAMHYEQTQGPETRWFGGITQDYQIEIATLAKAIREADMHMEYILFDDCYMSSVEVAYDLKDVTDYLIACPTEIMKYGFPYQQCARYLTGSMDYAALCEAFIAFYSSYSTPCATIAVTDCRELENLAATVRDINGSSTWDESLLPAIQVMDGYSPTIFYDLGSYISRRSSRPELLERFTRQMERTVPYKGHTPRFYSAVNEKYYMITSYSGLTTSAPSRSGYAATYPQTAWGRATTPASIQIEVEDADNDNTK